MSRRVLIGVFLATCLVQVAVPLTLVAHEERTLRAGEVFRFRARAWDPPDPMRGRYVSLALEAETTALPNPDGLAAGSRGCLRLAVGADGFARALELRARPPADGPWIWARATEAGDHVRVDLPLDRYYMNERRAPEAERAWERARRDSAVPTWVEVRVRDGNVAIGGLFIDGVRIEDVLTREAARTGRP